MLFFNHCINKRNIQDPFSSRLFSFKDANHRNGDELIQNKNRDAKERIKSHLRLAECKTSILSLGYTFKDKNNFSEFINILIEVLPNNNSISFPINNEWFIIQRKDDKFGISCKNYLFK